MRVLITFNSTAAVSADPVTAVGGTILEVYSIAPIMLAEVDLMALDTLRANPAIKAVEPDGEFTIAEVGAEVGIGEFSAALPTVEPALRAPWGVAKVRASEVHARGPAGAGVKVAIIDTGIDGTHPDLAANYKGGVNFVTPGAPPADDHGHGTHVAGTVAAALDAQGVFGVAPGAGLYACKVLNAAGSGSWSAVIAAYQWCVANGIQVTNNSYGGAAGSVAVEAALNAAVAAGIVMIFAAGNTAGAVLYPAKYAAAIAVSATDALDAIASFSSRGPEIWVAAPGVNIESTLRGGLYGVKSGTSMACPHVAGAVALLLSNGVPASQARDRLRQFSADKGVPGHDPLYGHGLLDAYALVYGAAAVIPEFRSPIVVDGTGSTDPDGTIVAWNYAVSDGQAFAGVRQTIVLVPGIYNITLTVTDNAGGRGSIGKDCKIIGAPPPPPPPVNVPPTAAFTIAAA